MSREPSRTLPLVVTVFLPFASGFFLSFLFRNANAVISKDLAAGFALAPSDLGLLTSAYFLAFAAMQIPVGVSLDRYGPRKVVAALLLIAAAGAWVFALADGMGTLTLGRALVGIGVSACLMGPFKAFAQWFPLERQASMNGWVIAIGSMGAISATVPLELVAQAFGWRMIFHGLAFCSLAIAAWVWLVVPDKPAAGGRESWGEQFGRIRAIVRVRSFWQIGLPMVTVQAVYQALFGLWLVPWLIDTGGLERAGAAQWLFWVALASTLGSVFFGVGADHLAERGASSRLALYKGGCVLAVLAFFAIVLDLPGRFTLLVVYAFGAIAPTLAYALLTRQFPIEWSGRVTTAINMSMFAFIFVTQWGVGALLRLFPAADGRTGATAYALAFAVFGVCQLAAVLWLLMLREDPSRKGASPARP